MRVRSGANANLGSGVQPPAPGGLIATAGNRRVFLSWNPVVGANSYNVFSATNLGGTFTLNASGLTVTNFVDLNAQNGRTNYYQVVTVSGCGASTNSPATAALLPLPVVSVTLGGNGNALNLSWPGWAGQRHSLAPERIGSPAADQQTGQQSHRVDPQRSRQALPCSSVIAVR